MKAGTRSQEAVIDLWRGLDSNVGKFLDFTETSNYLKSIGLYSVCAEEANLYRKVAKDSPYFYGSEWLHWSIPSDDLKEIESLF